MSSENIQNTKDQLEDWAKKYQDALDNGILESPKEAEYVTPQTSDHNSFYGMQNTKASSEIRDADAQYWNKIGQVMDYDGNLDGDLVDLISESDDKKELSQSAAAIASSPNPVRVASVGVDQDSETSMGQTWTPEDLNKLNDLKIQLHDIESKLASLEDDSDKVKYESLKKQISELSDNLGKTFPKAISSQGD